MKFHDPDDISSSRLNFMIKMKGQNWDEDGFFIIMQFHHEDENSFLRQITQ